MTKSIFICGILITYLALATAQENTLEGPLSFNCGSFQTVSSITTVFFPNVTDRLWFVKCSPIPGPWENCFDTTISAAEAAEAGIFCGAQAGILTGAVSSFNPIFRDREWTFTCCRSSLLVAFGCGPIPQSVVNQDFTHQIPVGLALGGILSFFDPLARDRRWSSIFCNIGIR